MWSHRNLFVGVDPWYNPAHLLLYGGFLVLLGMAYRDRRSSNTASRFMRYGVVVVVIAATSNEFWHRVLLFGNPIPEPFPVEPPHALLAVGLFVIGLGALLASVKDPPRDFTNRLAASLLGGSLWLILAGSFFYVGAAFGNASSYFVAVLFGSLSSALFLRYASGVTGKFGYATLGYAWFLTVNYVFFIGIQDGLPLGISLALVVDYLLMRDSNERTGRLKRFAAMALLATLFGVVYYPLLPTADTLTIGPVLGASVAGVLIEAVLERLVVSRISRPMQGLKWSSGTDGSAHSAGP